MSLLLSGDLAGKTTPYLTLALSLALILALAPDRVGVITPYYVQIPECGDSGLCVWVITRARSVLQILIRKCIAGQRQGQSQDRVGHLKVIRGPAKRQGDTGGCIPSGRQSLRCLERIPAIREMLLSRYTDMTRAADVPLL